jgi:hypothetical protein
MQKRILARQRPNERGQTIIFVAISLISLLAMAALAIDIVTLYVARSEIQRASDATALAAAKAISDSGFTTLPATDPNYATAQSLAQSMATASVNGLVTTPAINLVGGRLPVLVGPPSFDFTTHPGSYQVTVSLKSANLPTFFSKIWSRSAATVAATATAEAYNPANLPTMTPIALKSVKPWLIANADPTSGTFPPRTFVNSAGVVELGVVGEVLNLTSDCGTGLPSCPLGALNHNPPTATTASKQVDYVPALVADNTKNVCPACAGGNDFEQSVACADVNPYAAPFCGNAPGVTWDSGVNPGGGTGHSADAAECLIHASTFGSGKGQDLLDPTPWPTGPMQIKAQSGPQNGNLVMTSSSVVTIPIIDTSNMAAGSFPASGNPLNVVGYMQAFIKQVQDGTGGTNPGDINITVLNIAACSSTPNNGANPVVGGSGTSPVPVRLITSP